MLPLTLQTARLTLRPVEGRDAGPVMAGMNDLNVSGWLSRVPYPYALSDFQAFQAEFAVPGHTFVIEDKAGFAGIVELDDVGILGYWLSPAAQGKGYMTEAALALVSQHFKDNETTLVSGYFEGNAPSANVLHKLGFRETGRNTRHCLALAQERSHVDLAMTRHDFALRHRA